MPPGARDVTLREQVGSAGVRLCWGVRCDLEPVILYPESNACSHCFLAAGVPRSTSWSNSEGACDNLFGRGPLVAVAVLRTRSCNRAWPHCCPDCCAAKCSLSGSVLEWLWVRVAGLEPAEQGCARLQDAGKMPPIGAVSSMDPTILGATEDRVLMIS